MKKVVLTVAALIGILWGYNAYSAAKASDKLTYQAGSFRFDKVTATSIAAHGTLDVYNPTNTSITIGGITGEVYLNNSLLANFNNQKNITIAATSRTVVQYDVSSFSTQVLNALIAALALGKNQSVTITGYVRYGVFQMPFRAAYNLQDIIKNWDLDTLIAQLGSFINNYNK